MPPGTVEAVIVLLLAIVPGYLGIATWARAKTWRGFGGDLDTVLRSLAISLVVQVLMFPLALHWDLYPKMAYPDQLSHDPRSVFAWLALTILLVPVGGGLCLSILYDRLLFPLSRTPSSRLPWYKQLAAPKPPTGWDTFFLQNVPDGSFLLIELEDNSRIGGTWENGAYASTSPAAPAVFMPREWKVNDDLTFGGFVQNSAGVYITDASKIRRIRVLV